MCVLRVTGKQFDADFYLAKSRLTACNVFHTGEPRVSLGKKRELSGSPSSSAIARPTTRPARCRN